MAPAFLRANEVSKYVKTYQDFNYKMGKARKQSAELDLAELPSGSLLDVGCGRGEVLDIADGLGFESQGVEVVPALIRPPRVIFGEAHDLPFPDNSFDNVTMFDVMEHLCVGDDELAVRELLRVARQTVTLTIADFSHKIDGVELHINRRSYDAWDALLRKWSGCAVEWKPNRDSISETWLIYAN